jgi:small GTP-binding protein
MGNSHCRFQLFGCAGLKKEMHVLMIGLDGAGKTSIFHWIQTSEAVATIPTIGYNIETVPYKNTKLVLRDAGGKEKVREIWDMYYKESQGVIFVFDCNDRNRMDEAFAEFHGALNHEDLRQAAVLVFANKQVAMLARRCPK